MPVNQNAARTDKYAPAWFDIVLLQYEPVVVKDPLNLGPETWSDPDSPYFDPLRAKREGA
jgi:hypothetical protein